MADVAYPTIYGALYEVAEDALGDVLRVVDGFDLSADRDDVLCLGVPNLADESSISAAQFEQEQVGHGSAGIIRETGSINGVAWSWNGDGDSQAARIAAAGYIATLGAAIRADRSLGVTDFNLVAQMGTGDVAEDKVDGATCAISFTVNYTALLGD